jgi:hypothetical protein
MPVTRTRPVSRPLMWRKCNWLETPDDPGE